jgi:hypothetical protein
MVDEGGITLRTGDDGNLEPDPTGHTLEKQMALRSTPEPYTGPTAGGAPTNLPAGINRLTGKPNAPAAPAAPVNECNYTMENRYCPVHGLEDCGTMGMFESELARIKALMK